MKHTLNTRAAQTLNALVLGLEVGDARVFDHTGGTYMALHVDRLGENRFSLAHYYEQNGDRVCDPDGEFWRSPQTGAWMPLALQLCTGHFTRAIELTADETAPERWNEKALKELVGFCQMWLGNVLEQQGGLAAIKAAAGQKTAC